MARSSRADGVSRAPKSKLEAKADATTRAVRAIITQEQAAIAAKTERLRAARLARDSGEENNTAPTAKKPKSD